jgi:hypothetical protein
MESSSLTVTPTTATMEAPSASPLTVHLSPSVVTQSMPMIVVRIYHAHPIILAYASIILVAQATQAGRPGGLYGLTFTDVAYRQA